MGRFTPLFRKDGNTLVVPSTGLLYDTDEEAVAGGAAAGLEPGYGLVPTGEAVELQENGDYPGPFLIASTGNIVTWIVGGADLDALTSQRSDVVVNLPEEKITVRTDATQSPVTASGDATGPEI